MTRIRYAGRDSDTVAYYPDSRGRDTMIVDSYGHATRKYYDGGSGNLATVMFPGAGYTQSQFDSFGRDSLRRVAGEPYTRFIYDTENRLVKRYTLGEGDTIALTYDPLFLIRSRDAKGQVFRRQVDASGSVDTAFDPADTVNRFVSYRYNRDRTLTSVTNRRGQRIDLTYDGLHRLASKGGANTTLDSLLYSSNRRILVGANSVSRDSVFSAPSSWVDSVVTHFTGGKRFRYFYGHNSSLMLDSIAITSNTGIVFPTQYLAYDPTTQTVDSLRLGTDSVAFVYDNALRLALVHWGSALTQLLFYNNDSRVDGSEFPVYPAVDSALFRVYALDSAGRISGVATKDVDSILVGGHWQRYEYTQHDYAYDGLARLAYDSISYGTACSGDPNFGSRCDSVAGASLSLAYDQSSNLTGRDSTSSRGSQFDSATYAPGNRLESASWLHLSYQADSDGNIRRKYGATTDIRYGWSAENRLVGDTVAATGASIGYAYNAFGMLARRDRGGLPDRYYLWSGGELSVELDGTDTSRISEYAYAPQQVTAPFAIVLGATAIGPTRYVMQDALGSVIGVVYGSTVVQRREYDRWGNRTLQSGLLADTNRLGWKALLWEGDSTQLYYARNRWYDPATGRFVNEDPEGTPGAANQYAYGDDDAINAQDPLGTHALLTPCNALGTICAPDLRGAPTYTPREIQTHGCPALPSAIPPGPNGDVDRNIRLSQEKKDYFAGTFMGPQWWQREVSPPDGEWAFTQQLDQNGKRKYKDYGDFNFAATGRVFYSAKALEAAGGFLDHHSLLHPNTWNLRTWGDDPEGHRWILAGVQYYDNKCYLHR